MARAVDAAWPADVALEGIVITRYAHGYSSVDSENTPPPRIRVLEAGHPVPDEAGETAAKEKLDSETRLFQTGESTNFFVLTRQNEYLDARRRAVFAQLEWYKANARLEEALGSTLAVYEITIR